MPFDPLWQLLEYPINNQDFYDGKTSTDSSRVYFNFSDSINIFKNQNKTEQLTASLRRVKQNGIKNNLIERHIKHLKTEIDYYHNHYNVEKFNESIDLYNASVTLYNDFVMYRNKRFKPKKSNKEIYQMLNSIIEKLKLAKGKLKINKPKENLRKSITETQLQIEDLLKKVKKQQDFLDKSF